MITGRPYLRFDSTLHTVHRLLSRLNERVGSFAADSPEIIVIDGPKHDTAELLLGYIEGFLHGDVHVVKSNPLVSFVSVRSHDARVLSDQVPSLFQHLLADLVVSQVTILLGALTLLPRPNCRARDLMGIWVGKSVAASVCRDPQNELVSTGSMRHIESHCSVDVEILSEVVIGPLVRSGRIELVGGLFHSNQLLLHTCTKASDG